MRSLLALFFVSCLLPPFSSSARAQAQAEASCEVQSLTAKEKIQSVPVIFKGKKSAAGFEAITNYKGLFDKKIFL
jgi:hypothetical protein